jgi:hypothetical protein
VAECVRLVAAVVGLDEGSTTDAEVLRQLGTSDSSSRGPITYVGDLLVANARLLATLVWGNRPWLLTLHLSRTLTGALAASFLAVVTPGF